LRLLYGLRIDWLNSRFYALLFTAYDTRLSSRCFMGRLLNLLGHITDRLLDLDHRRGSLHRHCNLLYRCPLLLGNRGLCYLRSRDHLGCLRQCFLLGGRGYLLLRLMWLRLNLGLRYSLR
jgi:hypothetical protein